MIMIMMKHFDSLVEPLPDFHPLRKAAGVSLKACLYISPMSSKQMVISESLLNVRMLHMLE